MNFSNHLNSTPILKQISQIASEASLESYVIGGYVRDLILGRNSKDIDIVCVGSGIGLANKVAKKLNNARVNVFKNFGTAMISKGSMELEFVGARKESYQRDSRKPIVENGTLQDDQLRRDFTINALAISLNKENYGDLLDPFDGLTHLKSKMIKTPTDANITFSDDPLRMMRAIRFATQLGFDIDPDTFSAITENLERIKIVSQERITDELTKIILAPDPGYGFNLLFHSGLLKEIFPEMVALHGVEEVNGQTHKDNFYHTLQVLNNVAEVSDDLWLRWGAILHDIAKPPTKRFDKKVGWTFHGHEDKGARMVPKIFRKLKLPLDHRMDFVQKLVRLHLRPIALVKDDITDTALRRLLFEAGEDIDALMKLCRADITSKNHDKVKRYLRNFDKVEEKLQQVEEKDRVRNFQPPISGTEIINTFAITPSKIVGEIKDEIKEAILEGKIKNNYQEAYNLMLTIAEQKGLKPKENKDLSVK